MLQKKCKKTLQIAINGVLNVNFGDIKYEIMLFSLFGNMIFYVTFSFYIPEFGISDSRFSCYARFPTCAYYICPPNNMDGKMQNCKVQMKFTL